MFLYLFCLVFVFLYIVKIPTNTKTIQKIPKNTLCIFLYFSITSKNALCIFVFLYVSINSQIALCPFVFFVLLTCPQRTKPRIHQCVLYVPFVDDFGPLSVAFFCVIWVCIFGIFNDYKGYRL